MLNNQLVTRKEWGIVFFIAFFLMLLSVVPYIYAQLATNGGTIFIGTHILNSSDTYSYLSWIEQARNGSILFKVLYTSEAQLAILLHPLFLILGLINRLIDVPNIVLFHSARFIAGIVFCFIAYRFIADYFNKKTERLICLLVLLTSSGLGWLVGGKSSDLWMTESVTFLSLYESLINIVSLSLMLGLFIQLRRNPASIIIPALLINILTLTHSYYFVSAIVLAGLYLLVDYYHTKSVHNGRAFLWILALSLPSVIWQSWVLIKNSSLGIWATLQTNTPAIAPVYYLTGYGLLLLFGVIGLVVSQRQKQIHDRLFLVGWIVVTAVLMYLPVLSRFQRKFNEGLHIPIAILACMGILWCYYSIPNKFRSGRYVFLISYIAVLSFSNILLVTRDIREFGLHKQPYFITSMQREALVWLSRQSEKNGIILSGYYMGNLAPAYTANLVYVGHYDQTVNFLLKYELVTQLLSTKVVYKDPLKYFVAQNGINYIVIDEEVRSWGGFDATGRDYLELAYSNEDVQIYKVK